MLLFKVVFCSVLAVAFATPSATPWSLDIGKVFGKAEEFTTEAFKGVISKIEGNEPRFNFLPGSIGNVVDKVKNASGSVMDKVSGVSGNVFDAVSGASHGVISTAKDTVNFLKNLPRAAIDKGINLTVTGMETFLVKMNMDHIPLPSIDLGSGMNTFKANGGRLGRLSRLARSPGLGFDMREGALFITFPLRIVGLEIEYSKFEARLMMIPTSGNFSFSVEKNGLEITLKLTPALRCALSLHEVKVIPMEGLKMHLGEMAMGMDKVINFFSDTAIQTVQPMAELAIQQSVNMILTRFLNAYPLICSSYITK